jgi:hypothetical protein
MMQSAMKRSTGLLLRTVRVWRCCVASQCCQRASAAAHRHVSIVQMVENVSKCACAVLAEKYKNIEQSNYR